MSQTHSTDRRHGRRRFLAIAALTGGAILAGCTGDSDGGTGGDRSSDDESTDNGSSTDDANGDDVNGANGDNGNDDPDDGVGVGDDSADFDCGALSGAPTTIDPGDRSLVFLFDYPDTWEIYNEETSDTANAIGSFVGHSGTFEGVTYPINVYFNYTVQPSPSDALAEWHRPDFLGYEVVDTFEYQGESLDVVGISLDDRHAEWRVLLPSPVGEGYHRLQLMRGLATEYAPCGDAADEVAMDILASIRPNPDYSP